MKNEKFNKLAGYIRYVKVLNILNNTEKRTAIRIIANSKSISDKRFSELNLKLDLKDISAVQIMNLVDDIDTLREEMLGTRDYVSFRTKLIDSSKIVSYDIGDQK